MSRSNFRFGLMALIVAFVAAAALGTDIGWGGDGGIPTGPGDPANPETVECPPALTGGGGSGGGGASGPTGPAISPIRVRAPGWDTPDGAGVPTLAPIDPGSGSVLVSVGALGLSAKGGSVVQWAHLMTYDQRSASGPGDTVQGYGWMHQYQQGLTLANPGTPTSSDVTWRANAHDSFTFTNSGSYAFAANDRIFAVLSHGHAGHGSDTYTLEFPDGSLIVFHDKENHGTAVEQLKLKFIEDVYGNKLSVTYDVNGKIDYITDASGHYFRYTYLTSTGNSGKLDYIRAFKSSGTTDADLIAKIEFTYKDSGDGNDSGCGIVGDLIKTLVKTHKTGETGTSFAIQRSTHYRYWSGTYNSSTNPGHDHELKMILQPEHYQRAVDSLTTPLTSTDAQVDDFATYQFEYDSSNRARQMITAVGGSGCGGCGGGGAGSDAGTYVITYATQVNTTRNDWAIRTKVEHNGWTRYIDCNNWGETWQDVLITNDGDHSAPLWGVRYDRNSSGQVTALYSSSSISDYTVNTHAFTYVNDGVVVDYTYDSSAKQVSSQRIRKYSEGTGDARYVGLWEYTTAPATVAYRGTRYLLDKAYAYPTETTSSTDSSRLTTDYDYVCHPDTGDLDADSNTTEQTDRVMVTKATLPTVTTGQNGPNSAATRFTYRDTVGRLRWTKDEEGYIHYQSYNDLTGQLAYTVTDVFTNTSEGGIRPAEITAPTQESGVDIWADWVGAAPQDGGASPAYDFQNTDGTSFHVKATTIRTFDLQGRARKSTDSGGMISYMAYLDGETRSYPAWDSGTDKTLLPARRALTDKDGRGTESITVDPTSITFSDPPDGSENMSGQTNWVSWSTSSYDSNLRRSSAKAYHTIPSSGGGSSGTNYYETTWTYTSDSGARTTTVQVEDHESGYSRTTYNAHGQTTKVEGTATESVGSPTSWKTLSEMYYDQATPGTGASLGGNGNLTQVKSYYADASSNSTSFSYDWRHRRVLTTPPAAPYTLVKFDSMNRVVAVGTYSSAPSSSADPTSTSTNRLSLGETFFNNRGQVYQSKQWEILTNGTTDSSLVSDTYYDRIGRSVAVKAPGAGVQVTRYNGAGQVTQRQTCTNLGSTLYSGGAFDFTSDNKVIEFVRFTFNADGAVETQYRYELKAGAGNTTTLDPDAASPSHAIQTITFHWYDSADRRTQTTQYGTGTSNGLSGPMNASIIEPVYSAGTPATRSDTKLTTTWTFATSGRLQKVTDADAKDTSYEYDALGRRTAMIEDSAGLARRTEYQYNGNSDTTKLIARDVGEYGFDGGDALEDQVTQYVYGHGINSRWVTEIRYPGSDGQASSASADKVVFTYNNDGTVATRTDQNGSVITYDYDTLRRKLRERVTTVGSGVDNAVIQAVTTFDSSGRVSKLTNRDSATADAGNVVNEVQYTYNGYGQLTKDEQEHSGAVTGGTLNVQYAWTESSGSNHSRLNSITYPNGRDIFAKYTYSDAANSYQDEINDAFSRQSQWAEDSSSPGDVYVEYTFAGRSRVIKRSHDYGTGYKGNDTVLNYDTGTADQYAGLDFDGRVVAQKTHTIGDTAAVQADVQYQSNRDGSPKFAEQQNATVQGRSSLYTYDGLHRLSQADSGRLNAGRTDVVTEWSDPYQEVYVMDILGNFTSIDHKNSGTSASETRTHNATNELTSRTITAHAPIWWISEPFTDNDTDQWTVADLISGGGDGTWSAASGLLQNDTVVAVTGAPGAANGSMLLADIGSFNDFQLAASVTLSGSAENGGLVFGYVDVYNFWLLLANRATDDYELWQVSGTSSRTWNKRRSGGSVAAGGGTFALSCEVRSGGVEKLPGGMNNYAATIPAGKVGVWAGSGTQSVKADDFKMLDMGMPKDVDGRWYDTVGSTSLAGGRISLAAVTGGASGSGAERTVLRRGFRGGKYVFEYDHDLISSETTGVVLHYQDPENFMAFGLEHVTGTTMKPRLMRRKDGEFASLATGSNFTITSGDRVRVTIKDDPGNAALQKLEVYVAGTSRFTSTAIDDDWSAGLAGFYVRSGQTSTVTFDNCKIGIDNNADDDCDDAGDDVQIDDDFASSVVNLTYDNNGNMTDDGILKFVYDAWNRMVKAKRRVDAETVIATYSYDGATRRTKKVVANQGVEVVANDGGNTTVNYYFDRRQHAVETRNGSSQTTAHYVWGTGTDGLLLAELNGDTTIGNDSNPDVTASGEGSESPSDKRYFAEAARDAKLAALTEYDPAGTNNGVVAERYAGARARHALILTGDSGYGERSSVTNSGIADGSVTPSEHRASDALVAGASTVLTQVLTRPPPGPRPVPCTRLANEFRISCISTALGIKSLCLTECAAQGFGPTVCNPLCDVIFGLLNAQCATRAKDCEERCWDNNAWPADCSY